MKQHDEINSFMQRAGSNNNLVPALLHLLSEHNAMPHSQTVGGQPVSTHVPHGPLAGPTAPQPPVGHMAAHAPVGHPASAGIPQQQQQLPTGLQHQQPSYQTPYASTPQVSKMK